MPSGRRRGPLSPAALRLARAIAKKLVGSEEPALRAASWDVGQIMGFHANDLGFTSAAALAAESAKGLDAQPGIWLRFMERKPDLVDALRRGALVEIATLYNGTGTPKAYAAKLQQAGAPNAIA